MKYIIYLLLALGGYLLFSDLYHNRALPEPKAAATAPASSGMPTDHDVHTDTLNRLDEAIEAHPDRADLRARRGTFYLTMGRPTEALSDFDSAIEMEPENPELLTARASAYRAMGQTDPALEDLVRALDLDPQDHGALFTRAAIFYSQERFQEAAKDYDTVIADSPELAIAYFNRAHVWRMLNDRSLAEADIERYIELTPDEERKAQAKTLLEQWTEEP